MCAIQNGVIDPVSTVWHYQRSYFFWSTECCSLGLIMSGKIIDAVSGFKLSDQFLCKLIHMYLNHETDWRSSTMIAIGSRWTIQSTLFRILLVFLLPVSLMLCYGSVKYLNFKYQVGCWKTYLGSVSIWCLEWRLVYIADSMNERMNDKKIYIAHLKSYKCMLNLLRLTEN